MKRVKQMATKPAHRWRWASAAAARGRGGDSHLAWTLVMVGVPHVHYRPQARVTSAPWRPPTNLLSESMNFDNCKCDLLYV